jgi:hypothetical protein
MKPLNKLRNRTEDEWLSYLDRVPNNYLDKLAKKWGMNSLANWTYVEHPSNDVSSWCTHYQKSTKMELLLIHLDVNGKVR